MFEELLKCNNIKAVKESTRDISNVTRLKNSFGSRLKIMTGVDTIALESLLMGADGWIDGLVCAFPEETVAIYKLQSQNKIKEANIQITNSGVNIFSGKTDGLGLIQIEGVKISR